MATQWFCRLMGEDLGPFSSRDMVELVRKRKLTHEDMIRKGTEGNWGPAYLVQGLFEAAASSASDGGPTQASNSEPAKPVVHEEHGAVPSPTGLSGLLSALLSGHLTGGRSPSSDASSSQSSSSDANRRGLVRDGAVATGESPPATSAAATSGNAVTTEGGPRVAAAEAETVEHRRTDPAQGSPAAGHRGPGTDLDQGVKKWFCLLAGERRGPMSLDELRQFAAAGKLRPRDRVWSTTCPRWFHAHDIPELEFSRTD